MDTNNEREEIRGLVNGTEIPHANAPDKEVDSAFLEEMLKRRKTLKPTWRDALPQILASCIAHCIVIQAGANMAYSSILIPSFNETSSQIKPNADQESWIVSLVTITLPIGALITGPLIDKFGRKTVCILTCLPTLASWILIIVAKAVETIYIARILAGVAAGLSTVGLVYVSEIAHPQLRPMLLCLNSVFVSLGMLITYILAVWLNSREVAMAFTGLNCFVILVLFVIPESPYWLLCFNKGMLDERRTAKAERSLRWLNHRDIIFEQEYARIKETCRACLMKEKSSLKTLDSLKLFFADLTEPGAYKPILILSILLLLQQLSGTYTVVFYAKSVFNQISKYYKNGVNEYHALVLVGVVKFLMSILTSILSRRTGRRVLCIASGLGMTFSMLFSGMFLFLTTYDKADHTMRHPEWIVLFIVLLYICASSLGFTVIPWTLIGELLPIKFRGIGSGIMVSIAYVMMFAMLKSYNSALQVMGQKGLFFFFSLMSLTATGFVYFCLPETLGKSFAEIESRFVRGKSKSEVNSIS